MVKSLFKRHSPVTTHTPVHVFCHNSASMNHQIICVTFVPEMTEWFALLDLWNHYSTLDISTWSLSQDYKIYTSPTWQLALHGWADWRLYEKKSVVCTDLYVQVHAWRTSCWNEDGHDYRGLPNWWFWVVHVGIVSVDVSDDLGVAVGVLDVQKLVFRQVSPLILGLVSDICTGWAPLWS